MDERIYDPAAEVQRAKRELEEQFLERPWELCAHLRSKLEEEWGTKPRPEPKKQEPVRPKLRLIQGGLK